MPEVLLLDKSAERLSARIAAAHPEVSVIAWSPGGGFRRNGAKVEAAQIAPCAGWISADVFAANCIDEYGDTLLSFDSVQWLQTANAGLDHPIYTKLAAAGVRITKSGAQAIPIAEFVLAHALAHYQQLDFRREAQRQRQWKPHRFRELWHSHWLIVGYGHIGAGVAKRAKGFDCEVSVLRRRQGALEFADTVAPLARLHDFLPKADFVVLACPANEETRGIADAPFFAAMKRGAVLVNVARGSLVDEDALVKALDLGRPEHAILDVFQTEPLPPGSPLWDHPGVTVAAHTSNAGHGTRPRGDNLFLDNLASFLAREPLFDEVDLANLDG